jgi:hypothetical protein
MRPWTSLPSVALILAGLVSAAISGCTSPGSQPIIGPDGSTMAHVHCGSDQGTCFRIAGELCPTGYELKPVLRGDDGNFLVRCRSAQVTASAALTCPLPVASATPASLMYPWPPPEAGTAVARPAKSSSTPGAEIDVGY